MLQIPKRPCLYTRLSYAPDGSLEKCEHQEDRGREAGARLGWPEFCCVYVDNSRSAWQRNRRRPDWDRMLLTLDTDSGKLIPADPKANHHHDGIMTYHGDRLIRQPFDLELLLNIADTRHIPLASVSGVRDLSSPDDRFVLRIEAAQACREVDNLSRRRIEGYTRQVIRHGEPQNGGQRPFGFGVPTGRTKIRKDPETGEEHTVEILDFSKPRTDETKLLATVARRLLVDHSVNGALRRLNEASTTTAGGTWTSRVMWSLLTAPRISGRIERDGVLYKASWDEVITEEERQALIALRERKREERPNPGPARKYLLVGGLTCGRCQSDSWRTKPVRKAPEGQQPKRAYDCSQCHLSRSQEHLDAYVSGRVLRLLNSPRFLRELHAVTEDGKPDIAADIAALELRKAQTRNQLEQLADNPDVDPALAMLSLASFDRKIKELRSQLATTARHRQLSRMVGISRKMWEAEPIDVRHQVVTAVFDITVKAGEWRGPGFNPDSVALHRKSLKASLDGAATDPRAVRQ